MNKWAYLPQDVRKEIDEMSQISEPAVLSSHIIQYLQKPLTFQRLWQLRPLLHRLTPECISLSPILQAALANIYIMEGKLNEAETLVSQMPPDSHYRVYTELLHPTLPWSEFLKKAQVLKALNIGPIPNLSLTAGRPYVRNGFRDVTPDWNSILKDLNQTSELLYTLYGPRWEQAFALARAEAQYMQNDAFNALVSVVGIIPLLTAEQDAQLLFAALMLEMLILVTKGQVKSIVPLIRNLRERLHAADMGEMLPNVDALEAHAALYDGNYVIATEWMRNCAPDEFSDFCMLDLYRYLVKLRMYLVQQKYLAFTKLATILLPMLKTGNRMMDECELQIIWSVCEHMRGDKESAFMHLERALFLGSTYHYDSLFSEEGEPLLRLLLIYRREHGKNEYLDYLIQNTRKTASYYPRYLKPQLPEMPALSETELMVLRYLADGRSNADISFLLDVQLDTVKAHCKHIFKKLEVSNRQAAVVRAMEFGIIEPVISAANAR